MLEISNLSKVYSNGEHALQNVTLAVDEGEILAVVGGSGSGKSTLLRLVAGLEQASGGRVRIDGETISAPHPYVGLVFQEPRLLPWLSVAGNVGFGLDGVGKAEREARVEDALKRVGLGGRGGNWPRELSGGMAQRAALARALVTRPRVLLLDEPFSALDALTRSQLQDHVADLWADDRRTMVLVTHDIEEALVLADRIVVLSPRPGRIAQTIPVSLPRPRNRDSSAFEAGKRALRQALDESAAGLISGEERDPALAI